MAGPFSLYLHHSQTTYNADTKCLQKGEGACSLASVFFSKILDGFFLRFVSQSAPSCPGRVVNALRHSQCATCRHSRTFAFFYNEIVLLTMNNRFTWVPVSNWHGISVWFTATGTIHSSFPVLDACTASSKKISGSSSTACTFSSLSPAVQYLSISIF